MKFDKNKIEEIMANMEQPRIDVSQHQREFRVTLFNTKKSAITGAILLILPFLFLSGVVIKHYLHIESGIFTYVYDWITNMDQRYGDHSILNWIIRILLTIGPLVAVAYNILAITHVRIEKVQKEIILSFKMTWLNWLIILICTAVFAVFFLYLLVENVWQ